MILFKKKSIIAILSVLCAICLIFAGANMVKADAQTSLAPVTLEATTMNETAEIRLTAPTGIRFTTNVAESDLAKFANTEDIKVVTMITPARYLTAAGLSFEEFTKDCGVTMKELTFNYSDLPEAVNGIITVKSVLLEVQEHNIAEPFVARTYITDGASIGYAGAQAKSIYDVASAVLAAEDYEADDLETLNRYTKSTVADAENIDSAIAEATNGKVISLDKMVAYGTITVPATAENLIIDGKGATVANIIVAGGTNVIIQNVALTESGITVNSEVVGLTIKNSTFTGTACVTLNATANNLVIDGCTFENLHDGTNTQSAILAYTFNGFRLTNNVFNDVDYNAVQFGRDGIAGKMVVTGNTFNVGDRVFRLTGSATDGSTCEIYNNVFGKLQKDFTRGYIQNDIANYAINFGVNTWTCVNSAEEVASGIHGATINAEEQIINKHAYANGTCTACGTVCSHDWDGNTCKNCGITINYVDYGKAVYLQLDGKVEGLDYNGVAIINNVNATITDGVVDATAMETLKAALELGQDVEILIPDETAFTIIKATAKYVTHTISNYEEFRAFPIDNPNVYMVLTNDIDCTGQVWASLGGIYERFEGVFDGQGYAIRNLTIDNPNDGSEYNSYSGNSFVTTNSYRAKFLLELYPSAVIRNVVFDGVTNEDKITKNAFIGVNRGLIENVVLRVVGFNDGFGGLVGDNLGTIRNCVLDYSAQTTWVKGYAATTNTGTIENVLVNEINLPTTTSGQFKIAESGEVSNCEQMVKTQREMYSYITDSTLKALYSKITFEALSALTVGTKSTFDFNGTTVNGYEVSLAAGSKFGFTNDYILDLQNRGVKAVKVWVDQQYYVSPISGMPTEGTYHWRNSADNWGTVNIGIQWGTGSNSFAKFTFSDDVLTPDALALFNISSTDYASTMKVYIEEFTDNYPVISGHDYTQFNEELADGSTVTVYRVEYAECAHVNGFLCSHCAGFMLSDAYLNDLEAQDATSITVMYRVGVASSQNYGQIMLGVHPDVEGWLETWVLADMNNAWLELGKDNVGTYTIEQARNLHMTTPWNGNSTWVEIYVIVNK